MAVRAILRWPDPRLRTRAAAVGAVSDADRALWADMIDTMEAMPGVGLAAVQLGVMRRLAVVDASRGRGQAVRLADPVVIEAAAECAPGEEASPCLPGVSAPVLRPVRVVVRYLDATGAVAERGFEGLWARALLHQIDHLDGRMYFDRLSRVKRERVLRRAGKRARA